MSISTIDSCQGLDEDLITCDLTLAGDVKVGFLRLNIMISRCKRGCFVIEDSGTISNEAKTLYTTPLNNLFKDFVARHAAVRVEVKAFSYEKLAAIQIHAPATTAPSSSTSAASASTSSISGSLPSRPQVVDNCIVPAARPIH